MTWERKNKVITCVTYHPTPPPRTPCRIVVIKNREAFINGISMKHKFKKQVQIARIHPRGKISCFYVYKIAEINPISTFVYFSTRGENPVESMLVLCFPFL